MAVVGIDGGDYPNDIVREVNILEGVIVMFIRMRQ